MAGVKRTNTGLESGADGGVKCCPYLDTVMRRNLDFDFEKVCCVTSMNVNVYGCLVCGKYYQGRGTATEAHLHSLSEGHHIFINMETLEFYCLPDNYRVDDASLRDIQRAVNPTYTAPTVARLDMDDKRTRVMDGSSYRQGIVGMNNIKNNDYINVIIQSLSRVPDFRDYFLLQSHGGADNPLVGRLGLLLRKLWSPNLFKAHVSPHEFLQEVSRCSNKRFQIHAQSDPSLFLTWLLNTLDSSLPALTTVTNSTRKKYRKSASIIKESFMGQLEITTTSTAHNKATKVVKNYSFLKLDIPAPPLFAEMDSVENIIPQVPLFDLLSKYNGKTITRSPSTHEAVTYQLLSLPKYLILQMQRFTKNNFFVEKNPTIINFPLKNLDMRDFINQSEHGTGGMTEAMAQYDLLANIVHEGSAELGKGVFKTHVEHKPSGTWFEIQDLTITEIHPQMVALSQAYIQIYQLKK